MGKNSLMKSVWRSRKMWSISLRATDTMRCQEPGLNMPHLFPFVEPTSLQTSRWDNPPGRFTARRVSARWGMPEARGEARAPDVFVKQGFQKALGTAEAT